ncbi:MAG TPA: 8-amino-7-oxononanoate synthase [Chitinophagaceae bacterium]
MKDHFLQDKLQHRIAQNSYRQLKISNGLSDLCSNDYLGMVKNGLLEISEEPAKRFRRGSTGSRLLSGNTALAEETEDFIAHFHKAEAALLFNSGYDANVGLLSCVPQKGDTILYDYLCHASIRDGIRLSFAQSYNFRHNDTGDLEKKIAGATGQVFVVTESVFSMDGDIAPLNELADICDRYGCFLIVDEAHATGVIGQQGEGVVQRQQLHDRCFARVHTFGKALGCHGAVVLGSVTLRDYLINFSRPFIYTTALPEAVIADILRSYKIFPGMSSERLALEKLMREFRQFSLCIQDRFNVLNSATPIQGIVIPGNEEVKTIASHLQEAGYDVRPILYPTVPKGQERLRIVLHSFNTGDEIDGMIRTLSEKLLNGSM